MEGVDEALTRQNGSLRKYPGSQRVKVRKQRYRREGLCGWWREPHRGHEQQMSSSDSGGRAQWAACSAERGSLSSLHDCTGC